MSPQLLHAGLFLPPSQDTHANVLLLFHFTNPIISAAASTVADALQIHHLVQGADRLNLLATSKQDVA